MNYILTMKGWPKAASEWVRNIETEVLLVSLSCVFISHVFFVAISFTFLEAPSTVQWL